MRRIFQTQPFMLNQSTSHMYITRAKVKTKPPIDVVRYLEPSPLPPESATHLVSSEISVVCEPLVTVLQSNSQSCFVILTELPALAGTQTLFTLESDFSAGGSALQLSPF
jgi:hypothetical protein